jgi:hypothetical protein
MTISSRRVRRVVCGLVLAATLAGTTSAVQAALVGHWNFDDGTATDLTGNGANGTLAGTAAIVLDPDPARGMVYSGDGNNSKIDLGNPASLNVVGQMSVAAWVKPNVIPQNQSNAGIVQRGHQTAPVRNEFVLRAGITGGSYQFGTWEPNQHATFVIPPEDLNTWVHLAGTMTAEPAGGFTYRLYRNGTVAATFDNDSGAGQLEGMLGDYTVGWAIGARGGVGGQEREWNGWIDDVRIYDHPLSADEVLMAMFGGPPPIKGDTDGDGVVEFEDFEPIRANFRKTVASRGLGDLVRNGRVDFDDFREWKTAFVGGGGSLAGLDLGFASNVPEPSTAVLALMTLLGICSIRRRSTR